MSINLKSGEHDMPVRSLSRYLLMPLSFAMMIAACSSAPTYKSVTYVRPDTMGGRMCIDQCKKSKEYCNDTCNLDYRACYNQMQIMAQREYDLYAQARLAKHLNIDMMPSDFEKPEKCDDEKKSCSADCESPYNSCYEDCGGKVNTETSCQFMCFN